MLITIVAVLDTLNLRVASQPLNSFLNQIGEFLPKLLGAGILLGVAWVVATLVKTLVVNALNALNVDERLNAHQDGAPSNQLSISQTIGTALYWFIFLLFLMPVLDTLGLQQALGPVNTLVSEILAILPNILGAVIIGAVGWFVANIVRRIVTNLLATTGVDHIGSRFGLSQASTSGQSLSSIIGTIVYVLILIPVAIAALNTLQIQAISVPAISMLQQILNAIPLIFTAAAILAIADLLGKICIGTGNKHPHQHRSSTIFSLFWAYPHLLEEQQLHQKEKFLHPPREPHQKSSASLPLLALCFSPQSPRLIS